VFVEDRWLRPPTRVLISLEADGGAYPGAVPDVPLARRMSSEDIQSAIDRDELPEFKDEEQELPDTLSRQQITKILDARKDMLRACDPEFTGTVKFQINLGGDGRVHDVQVPPTIDSDMAMCLVTVLTDTRFPAFSRQPIDFSWPMRF
jgi:hypothetical protein